MAGDLVVIIPAAGTGSRFGGPLPKQFVSLAGQPLILHVIERFLTEESVARVIVPVPEKLLGQMKNTSRVIFVAGGSSRQQSVMRGLEEAQEAELIAVHDAARPLFSPQILHAVIAGAREVGAALPVIPVNDTIHVMNEDATVAQTLERSMLGAAQTPQCFRAEILRDVLARAAQEQIEGTDEAGLAVRFGYTVRGVPGDPRNLKITVPEDLEIAESYLRQWSET